jgi:hypothetical protein
VVGVLPAIEVLMDDADDDMLEPGGGSSKGRTVARRGAPSRLVVTLNMSFPDTTRLSEDRLRSLVSIVSRGGAEVCQLEALATSGQSFTGGGMETHTLKRNLEVRYDIPDAHVDDAQEALVLFLELFLVKHLHGHNAVLIDAAA